MGKVLDKLNKQLKTQQKKEAEDSLKIYNYLVKVNNGRVWESQWNTLVTTHVRGMYPNNRQWYEPNTIGYTLLKGIETTT